MKPSLLDDSVEDALISMKEEGFLLPNPIEVWYTEEEWTSVERFHRLRVRKDGKMGIMNDRYPFIRMNFLGIDVKLAPEPKYIETIH